MQGSGAFVDAAAFCGAGGSSDCSGTSFDFCATLNTALTKLTTLSPAGGVVDARGVVPVPTGSGTGGGCPRGKNSDLVRGKQRLPTLLQAADKKVAPR